MKKIRNVILCTVIILSLFLSSCSDVDSYNGDVAYEVVSAEDGTAWINGLSPAGREKTSVWLRISHRTRFQIPPASHR